MDCKARTTPNPLYFHNTVKALLLVILLLVSPVLSPQIAQGREAALEKTPDGSIQDLASGQLWQSQRSQRRFSTAEEVDNYLAKLREESGLSWRLPTKEEFSELYEIFDLKRNKDISMQLKGNYWFTDKNNVATVGGWEPAAGCGPGRTFYLKKKGYVRAVRDAG